MKFLKGIGAAALVIMLFASCEKNDYTCQCEVQQSWGHSIEELQIGFAPKNTAQKRCYNYQKARTEELRGTKSDIQCRVKTEL